MKFSIIVFVFSTILFGCSSHETPNKIATPPKAASKLWLGSWERQLRLIEATLEITNIRNDSIEFKLSAASGGHTGEIEGMAIVRDSTAIFLNNDASDTCLIQFKLISDSLIIIDQKTGNCFTGLGVVYSGEYKNIKTLPEDDRAENLVDLKILNDETQDSIFKSLVGDSYSLFVRSTQLTSADEDLDSLHAKVLSSGVRGLFTIMENIVMIDSLNNIWAAVIDDNKIYYFTNNKEFKNKLPKTIDNWRQNFKGYQIIYK
jgi:hypothetical protein